MPLENNYYPELPVQAVSRFFIKQHKPTQKTLLIAINDYMGQYQPFKERTKYITYSKYEDVCWLFFDDIDHLPYNGRNKNMFSTEQARQIIHFLNHHFQKQDFEQILVHCYAGISRSQALALFIARYYLKDETLYEQLYHQKGKAAGGNHYVYELLEKTYHETK